MGPTVKAPAEIMAGQLPQKEGFSSGTVLKGRLIVTPKYKRLGSWWEWERGGVSFHLK